MEHLRQQRCLPVLDNYETVLQSARAGHYVPGDEGYAQLLSDASEVCMTVIDPHQGAQNTTMGGLPPNPLTLEPPVQKPPVSVSVIELFLKS